MAFDLLILEDSIGLVVEELLERAFNPSINLYSWSHNVHLTMIIHRRRFPTGMAAAQIVYAPLLPATGTIY